MVFNEDDIVIIRGPHGRMAFQKDGECYICLKQYTKAIGRKTPRTIAGVKLTNLGDSYWLEFLKKTIPDIVTKNARVVHLYNPQDMLRVYPKDDWLQELVANVKEESLSSEHVPYRKRTRSEEGTETGFPQQELVQHIQKRITTELQSSYLASMQRDWLDEFEQSERDAYICAHCADWDQEVKTEMRQAILQEMKRIL